jgi:hypothetical protein
LIALQNLKKYFSRNVCLEMGACIRIQVDLPRTKTLGTVFNLNCKIDIFLKYPLSKLVIESTSITRQITFESELNFAINLQSDDYFHLF